MSGQLALPFSEELEKAWVEAQAEPGTRGIQAVIEDEKLGLKKTIQKGDSMESDCDSLKSLVTEEKEACFFLVRFLDSSEFVQVNYIPDAAPPKARMVYASTAEYLKSKLGSAIKATARFAEKADITWENIKDSTETKLTKSEREALMTDAEREEAEVKRNEVVDVVSHRSGAVKGVPLAMPDASKDATKKLVEGENHVVVFRVQGDSIVVDKESSDKCSVEEMVEMLPEDEPRFSVYRYHAGDKDGTFFVYTCPSKSKVKTRFEYSSTKSTVISHVRDCGVDILKNLEFSDNSDFTDDDVRSLVAGEEEKVEEKKFSKPKRPGRGGARLI